MSEFYCTNCGADIGEQPGFDPDGSYWHCTECGQLLTDPNESDTYKKYKNVSWFCDGCGAYLDDQPGFSDYCSSWICSECGYMNNISEDEIYSSEEEYRNTKKISYSFDSIFDNSDNDTQDDEDGEDEENEDYHDDDNEDEDDDDEDDDEDEHEDDDDADDFYEIINAYNKNYSESQDNDDLLTLSSLNTDKQINIYNDELPKNSILKKLWRNLIGKKQKIGFSSEKCKELDYNELFIHLRKKEFYNITTKAVEDLSAKETSREGIVQNVIINNISDFIEDSSFPFSAKIEILYHAMRKQNPPFTSRKAKGKNVDAVRKEFADAGFANIRKYPIKDLSKGIFTKVDSVEAISINGQTNYKKSEKIRIDAKIVIKYHKLKDKKR